MKFNGKNSPAGEFSFKAEDWSELDAFIGSDAMLDVFSGDEIWLDAFSVMSGSEDKAVVTITSFLLPGGFTG